MFNVGTKLIFKHNNQPAYEKVGVDLWSCLCSNYLVKEQHLNPKTGEMEWIDVSYPETDLPLFRKDGSLNRFGFKWSDEMVTKFYGDIMIFNFDGVV